MAEVVYDPAAATAIPGLVRRNQPDAANGRFRIAEIADQELLGRPLTRLSAQAQRGDWTCAADACFRSCDAPIIPRALELRFRQQMSRPR